MRTRFWAGCAVVVSAAVGVYLAAGMARHEPDSLAGKAVRAAGWFGVAPALCAGKLVGEAVRHDSGAGEEKPSTVAAAAASVVEPTSEVIDLSQAADKPEAQPLEIDIVPTTLDDAHKFVPVEGDPAQVVIVPPLAFEESDAPPAAAPAPVIDDVPATMPPCADDEEKPAAKTEQKTEGLCEFWRFLFEHRSAKSDVEPGPMPTSEEGSPEESEPMREGKAPECRMAPDQAQEYPACPPLKTKKKKPERSAPTNVPPSEEVPTHFPEQIEALPQDPSVDTMEFRKSDAKKGEFAPKPF